MPLDPSLKPLLGGFVVEAEAIAAAIGKRLMELERSAAPDATGREAPLAEIARGLHTLKGTSGTFGLSDLAELAHALEDTIVPLRRARGPVAPAVADALLRGLDVFLAGLKAHAEDRTETLPELWDTIALLRRTTPGATKPEAVTAAELDVTTEGGEVGSWRVAARDVAELVREVERLRALRLRLERRSSDVGKALEMRGASPRDLADVLLDLRRGLASDRELAADVVGSLEEAVKTICTLPVRTVLDPLHRSVRDLCRRSGKRARLSIVGGEVKLDRRLLDALRSPLVHLVRNAVDHGIEAPAERERRGKHDEGSIVVRVDQRGNILMIEVSDDGAGIDPARVRDAALSSGMATPEELGRMGNGELLRLIFRAGLTTRGEVTETSGRGVGLDVVQARIATLQGHVDVESTIGQGTRLCMSVPSEIGSSAALVVRVGEQTLGVPMHSITAVVAAKPAKVRASRSRVTLEHDGRALPVEDLGALLGLRQARVPGAGDPLLLIGGARTVAIGVDEIAGDVDVVVRPLPEELRELPAYQGAATSASGELMLVLRPEWLAGHDPGREIADARRALVVDDSLTARALHRTVLEAAGFVVHAAGSAEQALQHVSHTRYDVVVCDVAMEGMDGIELCATLRSRATTRDLPVILVSAREEESVRRRALAAGAASFLTKRECASGRLIAEVSGVLRRGSDA